MVEPIKDEDQDSKLVEMAGLGYEVQDGTIDGVAVRYIQVNNHSTDLEIQNILNSHGYMYSMTYSHPGPLPIENAPLSQCRLPKNHSFICIFRKCSVDIYTKSILDSEA